MTWQWIAPEAYLGLNYDERCDLYSFGMILWELLNESGDVPFQEFLATSSKEVVPGEKFLIRDLIREVVENGLRPRIPEKAKQIKLLPGLVESLWDHSPATRPGFKFCVRMMRAQGLDTSLPPAVAAAPKGSLPGGSLKRAEERRRQKLMAAQSTQVMSFDLNGVEVPLNLKERIKCFTIDSSNQNVWIGGANGGVYCFNLEAGKVVLEQRHGQCLVNAIIVGFDGRIWTAGDDGRIQKWELPVARKKKRISMRFTAGEIEPNRSPSPPSATSSSVTAKSPRAARTSGFFGMNARTSIEGIRPISPREGNRSPREGNRSPREGHRSPRSPRGEEDRKWNVSPRKSQTSEREMPIRMGSRSGGNEAELVGYKEVHAHAGSKVLCLQLFGDRVASGDNHGNLVVSSADEPEFFLKLETPINSLAYDAIGQILYVCAVNEVYRLVEDRLVHFTSHSDTRCKIACVGKNLWTFSKAKLLIWSGAGRLVKEIKDGYEQRWNCISQVDCNSWPTVWAGLNDEIVVYSNLGTCLRRILKFKGDIIGINQRFILLRKVESGESRTFLIKLNVV
jgi:hypothetical protein